MQKYYLFLPGSSLPTPHRLPCLLLLPHPPSLALHSFRQPAMPPLGPTPTEALDFFHLVSELKKTKRTGWVRSGIAGPESIADHMYRMGLMAMVAPSEDGIDIHRAIQVALVHDLAESLVGDITPDDPVTKEEKYRQVLLTYTQI